MNSRRPDGILGPDLVVHGKLSGKSDLRIDGVLEGTVDLDGALTVGADARVTAPIAVTSLELEGRVRGDVHASSAVAIRSGGRLVGDVHAPRIGIDDGGALEGGIEMDFELPSGEGADE